MDSRDSFNHEESPGRLEEVKDKVMLPISPRNGILTIWDVSGNMPNNSKLNVHNALLIVDNEKGQNIVLYYIRGLYIITKVTSAKEGLIAT